MNPTVILRNTVTLRNMEPSDWPSARSAGIWTIQASVFPENGPSLRLHETAGFVIVGRRNRMSHSPLSGQRRDTILIERRSPFI